MSMAVSAFTSSTPSYSAPAPSTPPTQQPPVSLFETAGSMA